MKKVLFTLGLVALAGVMVACGGTSSSVTPSTSSGEPSVSSPSAPNTPSTSVTPSTPSTTTPAVSGPKTVAEALAAEDGTAISGLKMVVVAKHKNGFIGQDSTGLIYVYGFDLTAKVGDYVSVTGSASDYYKVNELDVTKGSVTVLDETAPTLTAPTKETWDAAKISEHYAKPEGVHYISVADATVKIDGKYTNIVLDGLTGDAKGLSVSFPDDSFKFSELNGATVTLEGYTFGANTAGWVNFLVTALEVTAEPQIPTYNTISDVLTAEDGNLAEDVKGVVLATNERGFVMQDNEAMVYVYANKTTANIPEVGDYVSVDGDISGYQTVMQIQSDGEGEVTVLEEAAPSLTAPTLESLDGAAADAYVKDPDGVRYVKFTAATILVEEGEYSTYLNFDVSGSDVTGAFQYPADSFGIADMNNKVVDLEGYAVGTRSGRINFLVTKITESTATPEPTPEEPDTPAEPVDGTVVAEYDFSEFSDASTSTVINDSNAAEYVTRLNAQSDTDTDLVNLSDYSNVYLGMDGTVGTTFLKFSSSKKDGKITFNFPEETNITAVQVYGAGWAGADATLTVGDAEAQSIASIAASNADAYAAGCKTYTFNLTEGTNSIAFAATKRLMISKLTFITK